MLDVLAAGHLCLDIIPHIIGDSVDSAAFLAPGRITEVGEAILSGGGSVSNTGLALHRLGAQVRLVGRVGDDPLGEITLRILGASDPALVEHLRTAQGEAASYTIVLSPPGVDRTFLTAPGPNSSFSADDLDPSLLAQTRILHLGYPPLLARLYAEGGAELAEIMRAAHAARATTSLDMSMPDPSRAAGQADWRAIFSLALPEIDIFCPSAEELLFCLDRPRFDQLCRERGGGTLIDRLAVADIARLADDAMALGAQIVLIKVGHRGLYLRTGTLAGIRGRGVPADLTAWRNREIWAPAFSVEVVGTTGAGDATVGGFLLGILRGLTPDLAVRAAAAVGACNCEAADAVSGVRSWEATLERLECSWGRIDPHVHAAGWESSPRQGLWLGPHDCSR